MARIIFNKMRPCQPNSGTQQDLVDHDLAFLVDFLSTNRGAKYTLLERPDENTSDKPAPDYLLQESPTQRIIAVEHTLLMDQDLQGAIARRIKAGAGVVTVGFKTINPQEIGLALQEAVARKLARGQLTGVEADERILLVQNRLICSEETFEEAQLDFSTSDRDGVDSAYLIAFRHLLELW